RPPVEASPAAAPAPSPMAGQASSRLLPSPAGKERGTHAATGSLPAGAPAMTSSSSMPGAQATGASPRLLDTYREVITPEGVPLHLPAAGPVPRALAWLIDLALRAVVLMVLASILGLLGALGQGVYLVGLFLV